MQPTMDKLPLAPPERELKCLKIHTALYEMLNGTAGMQEWLDLADCINMVDALIRLRSPSVPIEPYRKLIDQAIEGMADAVECDEDRFHMGRQQVMALKYIVTKYEECLIRLSRGTLQRAGEHVILKIAASAATPDPEVRVVDPMKSRVAAAVQAAKASRGEDAHD